MAPTPENPPSWRNSAQPREISLMLQCRLQRVIQNAADDKSNLSEIGGLLTLQIQHLESILSRHSLREMVAVVDDEVCGGLAGSAAAATG